MAAWARREIFGLYEVFRARLLFVTKVSLLLIPYDQGGVQNTGWNAHPWSFDTIMLKTYHNFPSTAAPPQSQGHSSTGCWTWQISSLISGFGSLVETTEQKRLSSLIFGCKSPPSTVVQTYVEGAVFSLSACSWIKWDSWLAEKLCSW